MAPQIIFKDVSYNYAFDDKSINNALSHISFCIHPEAFTMIVGKTGSGKSTLIQQINGLLRPTHGLVKVGSLRVRRKMNYRQIKKLRQVAGFVFQIPQDQLFGETVRDDLAFGPKNLCFNHDQIKKSVFDVADLLRIDSLLTKSPFDLSGGQMKLVTIAGALACKPRILILDEPTAGLDHASTVRIMKVINKLRIQFHLTVVMVTHRMDLAAKYATQVLVLSQGKLMANVKPRRLFSNRELLHKAGLRLPFVPRMAAELLQRGIKLDRLPLTLSELADEITKAYRMGHRRG